MKIILSQTQANLEQIRLNDASIALTRAGYGTQTRHANSENFRDDTAESIAWLIQCNAGLRAANVILSAK
jgi:hypothetical protein